MPTWLFGGVPTPRLDHTEAVVEMALAMLEVCARLSRGTEMPFTMRIGINTGPVVAGSLGNERRTEYTCAGDTVNVASRLCALAEPREILLGEGTARAIGEDCEALPPVKLKGKANPVAVYRITGVA